MDTYLNEEEMVSTILNYLEEKIYHYAIMVDGEWGSGKTYFIKNRLIPQIEKKYKKRKIIYISLYGLNLLSDIHKQIYMSKYIGNEEKAFTIVSTGLSLCFDYLKSKGINFNEKNIKKLLNNLLALDKETILIFDDLERCKISINDVLGFINQFVEHQGMKIILIANEKEIDKSDNENLELKYLVALQKPNSKEIFDIEELESCKNEIFSRKTEYEIIKEKLIGLKIYFQPNIKESLSSITEEIIVKDLKSKIKDQVDFFYKKMYVMNHMNLRTFQFYLLKMSYIYDAVMTVSLDESDINIKNEFIDYLVPYVFEQCILYKKNGYLNYQENEMCVHTINIKESLNSDIEYRENYKFVKKYILLSLMDNCLIEESLRIFSEKYSSIANEKYNLLKSISSWHIHSEEKVLCDLNSLKGYLKNNEYPLEDFSQIIRILLQLKYYVEIDRVNEITEIMKSNIRNASQYIGLIMDSEGAFIENKNQKANYKEIIQELNVIVQEHDKKFNETYVMKIFAKPTWCHDILEEEPRLIGRYMMQAPIDLFLDVDVSILMMNLYEKNISDIIDFRKYVYRWKEIYMKRDNTYQSKIKQCITYIEKHCVYDRIKRYQMQCLRKELEEILIMRQ